MHDNQLGLKGGTPVRTRPWPARGSLGVEEKDAVAALFDQAIATGGTIGYGGAEENAYCQEFADALGGGFADAVNSGTTAVYVALRALDIKPFREVIVPAITDPGGMMPVPLLNCIPVVADVAPGSYNVGPDQIAPLISPLTAAIVVAHIGGEPIDMEAVMQLARQHGIPVVEDCAQSPGALLNGRPLGTFGDVAAFSTMFGKHFCTGGQGGVVFTRESQTYQRIRWASDRGKPFGLTGACGNQIASLNFNLDEIGATIGRVQLRKLPAIVNARRERTAQLGNGIADLSTVSLPTPLPGAEPSYWFVRLHFRPENARCDLAEFLDAVRAEGLPHVSAGYAAINPHRFDWYTQQRVFADSGWPWKSPEYTGDASRHFPCPNAEAMCDRSFNLALNEAWTREDVGDAIAILRKVDAELGRKETP